MPSFVKGGSVTTPFGRNEYMRSTRSALSFESYMLAAATLPARTIDGNANQKILQPGTVLAKITSGGDAGKVGPFQAGVTDGRQTPANIVGINDTFLPWQLIERDVEVSALQTGKVVQAWCFELDAGGNHIALSNTTAGDAVWNGKLLSIKFA
jgi:hypothetical protein